VNQLEVQIMGQSYLLGCPEGGEDRLRAAVARVDDAMCKIRDAGKVRARDRIAVLAALNLAFDLSDKPAVGATAADGSAVPESESEALRALLDRLDDALSEDGQLL
jgi:cell division protein ZapA